MLNKVVLRLTELLKEKGIISKRENDIDNVISVLSKKTSISKSTLESIFYKKRKTIRIDMLNQLCKDLNIELKYFFDSKIFD